MYTGVVFGVSQVIMLCVLWVLYWARGGHGREDRLDSSICVTQRHSLDCERS